MVTVSGPTTPLIPHTLKLAYTTADEDGILTPARPDLAHRPVMVP